MKSARKKTWFERLLSFNQHRKRFGAGKHSDALLSEDFSDLKSRFIAGEEVKYTHGSFKNVSKHLSYLRNEFAGQSELLYYHAQLIVMIRREYRIQEHIQQFELLWQQESDFLLQNLNTRWLVSATDTFSEHAKEPVARALALSASLLVNTIKIQEAERYLQKAESLTDNPDRHESLTAGRVALFDGMSAFAVGTDDTLRNMRWRMNDVSKLHPTGALLMEIFQRMQNHDTVYQRFRLRHKRDRTAWW